MTRDSSSRHITRVRFLLVLLLLAPAVGAVNVSAGAHAAVVRDGCGATGIAGVSPDYGPPNTVVTISGCGLIGMTEVLFGDVPASFHVVNNTTITAYAPHGVPDGSRVPVYANISTYGCVVTSSARHQVRPAKAAPGPCNFTPTTIPSLAGFTYPIGELDITGPYPHFFNQGENDEWWQSGGGHVASFEPPDTLPFALPSQVFHITTAFIDDSTSFPENQSGTWGGNGQYRNLGNSGGYGASLQVCDVENNVGQKYGTCKNWDGTTGYWEDVPNTYVSSSLSSPGGDGTVESDLNVQAPDPDPNQTNSDHLATYRFAWTLRETDSHGSSGLYRTSNGFSRGFNVIWAPVAYAQLQAQPYTILYHPTGDLSKASYATNFGFGTDYKLSNDSTVSDTYKDTQTNSSKFEESITALVLGVNFSDSDNWDNSTTAGFGSTVSTSDESTDATAIKTTWGFNNPDNSLVPGDGATCAPPAQKAGDWDCAQADLVHPSQLAQYMSEPFWEDVFFLNLHPQYRVYEVGSGKSMWIMKAAVPTLAHVSVLQLEDCRIGNWSGDVDPCLIQYGGANVTYNGNVVYHPTSCNNKPPQSPEDACLELTPQEATNLLALDPFYGAGQGADVQTSRGIPLSPDVGSYGASYPYNEKNPLDFSQAYDNIDKTIQGTGTVLTTKTDYSDVNATTVGGGFTLSESYGGLSEKGSMTLTSGEQTSTDYSQDTKYSDSTANTTTQETTASVDLNDFDNTTPASPGCAKCHNPMPQQPQANIYLDRAFGSFMYQDPNAPGAPGSLIKKIAAYKQYLAINFMGMVDGQAVSGEHFRDVPQSSPAREGIDVLAYLGFLNGESNDQFKPEAPMTEIDLATALASMVRLTPARTLDLIGGSTRTENSVVSEGFLGNALAKAMKIQPDVALRYVESVFPRFLAAGAVNRGQAAQVLFAALQGSCLEGCSYNPIRPSVAPVTNTIAVAAGPASGATLQGGSVSTVVETAPVSGEKQSLRFVPRGLPPGAKASFVPDAGPARGRSRLSISTDGSTPSGTYPITVEATGPGGSYRAIYELTVNPLKVATQLSSFTCSSSASNSISCKGVLTGATPAGGPGSPMPNRLITLTYAAPDGSSPLVDIAQTGADGSFNDQLSMPAGTPPIQAGTWQIDARYASDATTKATSASQKVLVQASGAWTRLGPEDGISAPTLLHVANGNDLAVWVAPATASGKHFYYYAELKPDGGLASPATDIFGGDDWGSLTGYPTLLADDGRPLLVFEGGKGLAAGDPYNDGCLVGDLLATGENAGPSTPSAWQLQAWSLSADCYQTDHFGATITRNGTLSAAWPGGSKVWYRIGAAPTIPAATPDNQVSLATGLPGQMTEAIGTADQDIYAAWAQSFSTPASQDGLWVTDLSKTAPPSGAPGPAPLQAPDTGTTTSAHLYEPVAMASPNDGGIYLAYCNNTWPCTRVELWRYGAREAVTVPGASNPTSVSLSAGPSGRLWIAWWSAQNGTVTVVRTNEARTAFGPVETYAGPNGCQSDGNGAIKLSSGPQQRLDVIVKCYGITSGTSYEDEAMATQSIVSLGISGSTAISAKKGGFVTYRVTDAGDAVPGATVTLIGLLRKGTTNGDGQVTFRFPAGAKPETLKVVASMTDYSDASISLRIR